MKSIYICQKCHLGFYYSKIEAENKLCRNCLTESLKKQEIDAIFACTVCHKHYKSNLIKKMNKNKEEMKNCPAMQLGMLICPRDGEALKFLEIKEDIESLTDDILKKFSIEKLKNRSDEKHYIEKLNTLRSEIKKDVDRQIDGEVKTSGVSDIIQKKVKKKYEEIKKENIKLEKEKEERLKKVEEKKFISKLKITPFKTKFAEEFWDNYFVNGYINEPGRFLGGRHSVKMIKGLLEEIAENVVNTEKFNLTRPIIEKVSSGKIFYVGDSHGSIKDTNKCIKFFVKEIKKAKENKEEILIIFDGDYIDRNKSDIHNILYIFTFALIYPQNVRLLRGNHEEVTINMRYGFWENINNYLPNSYLFNDFEYIFMNLPLVHIAEIGKNENKKRIMCLHGGIPFYPEKPEKFPKIPKIVGNFDALDSCYSNIDEMGIFSQQILWSDPAEDLPINVYYLPSQRGLGFSFGKKIFDKFCEINEIDRLIRAHEVYLEGYKIRFDERLFSLFSSSSYVGRKIDAKIMEIDLSKPFDKNWKILSINKDLGSI